MPGAGVTVEQASSDGRGPRGDVNGSTSWQLKTRIRSDDLIPNELSILDRQLIITSSSNNGPTLECGRIADEDRIRDLRWGSDSDRAGRLIRRIGHERAVANGI